MDEYMEEYMDLQQMKFQSLYYDQKLIASFLQFAIVLQVCFLISYLFNHKYLTMFHLKRFVGR